MAHSTMSLALAKKKRSTFCPREASDDARMLPNFRNAYIAPRPAWVDRASARLAMDSK